MNRIHRSPARGFTLLEVLVAVVVLSIGLLALAVLQASLIRASADAKAQTTALALGKAKLEELRSYTDIDGYVAINTSAPVDTTIGGVTYTVTPTVTRYVLNALPDPDIYESVNVTATEAALAAVTTSDYVLGRDFKELSVGVSWTDATNTLRTVTLEDLIDGLDPTASAKVVKNSASLTPRPTEIIISNPGAVAGVIPIAIDPSSSESTAATNPRPIIDQGGNETRFDVYTYRTLTGDTQALAQARVETTMVGCTCDTATKSTTDSAYRPTYWNGYRYVAPTLASDAPHAGHADLGNGKNATTESPYCTVCCRDHYDPPTIAANKPRFDPWRYAAGHAHDHYYYNNSNVLTLSDSGHTQYLEACRLIRVDGIYRVAADFNNEYFNFLQTKNDGTTLEYSPTTAAVTNYQNIALGYLDNKIVSNGAPSTYNDKVAAATLTTLETNNSINPAPVTLQRTADHKYMHGRGLYIDHLEQEAMDVIAQAKADCVTNSCSTAQKSVAVLSVTPFTSINLTELALWSPSNADNAAIAVTDGSFYVDAASVEAPIRGYVTPATMTNSASFDINATAKMLPSNSGLVTRSTAIDADEAADVASNTSSNYDSQVFSIPAASAVNNSGMFTIAFTGYDFPVFPQFSGTNITSCTHAPVGNGANATTEYTCNSSNLPTAPMTLNVSSYNYQTTAQTGLTISCTGAAGSVQHVIDKSETPLVTCKNYDLVSASSSVVGVTASPGTATGYQTTEATPVTVSSVTKTSPINKLTLNFTGPSTTITPYTCTYVTTTTKPTKTTYDIKNTSTVCP